MVCVVAVKYVLWGLGPFPGIKPFSDISLSQRAALAILGSSSSSSEHVFFFDPRRCCKMTQELREYGRPAAANSSGKKAVPSATTKSTAGGGGAAEETVRLSSQPLDNADIPCAFWDALPEPGTDHPDLLAIEALKAESSVLERAETLKVRENWNQPFRFVTDGLLQLSTHSLLPPTHPHPSPASLPRTSTNRRRSKPTTP